MNAIEAVKVTKDFGAKQVLRGIDLNVEKGEIFGLLGPSGAGKTTRRKRKRARCQRECARDFSLHGRS